MPGIPTNFPKPTILVHPPMHFDTHLMWMDRNRDWLHVADEFFSLFDAFASEDEMLLHVHHRDTWHGTDMSDWLYGMSLYSNPHKIGKSTCSAYQIYDHHIKVAAELFTLNSKRLKMVIAKIGGQSIDLAKHSEMWRYNGRTYDKVDSLLTGRQLNYLSTLTNNCMPKVGEESSRQFAAH